MKYPITFTLALSVQSIIAADSAPKTEPDETVELSPLVVTSADSQSPGQLNFDPKVAIQPLPANDGADALKHVAGFNVIRKGGTDGDPTFRGMAGSRLPILLDGACTLGGCGQRMDPPTAYIFPSSFDKVTILKGPQSVQHGPGSSAGVVLFERSMPRFTEAASEAKLYSNFGSFGRRELSTEATTGNSSFYARAQASWSESDDYKDGDGVVSNSSYERWNTQAAVAWTPTDTSALEFSASLSDGEAAYSDRAMDGVAFDRTSYAIRYRAEQLDGPFRSIDTQLYHSDVDHVMDNFSLRTFTATSMMPMPMVSNPDRKTTGGSLKLQGNQWGELDSTVGLDFQSNKHRIRKAMGAAAANFQNLTWSEDANFDQIGTFGEFEYRLNERNIVAFGGRLDFWEATDERARVRIGMGSNASMMPNPTANQSRSETLASGYLRLERDLGQKGASLHIGVGHSERFPDYWELFNKESASSISSFNTNPEKVTQLDMGVTKNWNDFTLNVSTFLADHSDFILIQSRYPKTMGEMTRMATISRNIDATTWGGEAKLSYQNDAGWYTSGSLAYTHGNNETDHQPLAQISPLEFKLEGGRRAQDWSFGYLVRMVDEQNRYAIGQGNIVGQDIGPSEGFTILSLHSSYRLNEYWGLAAGIDNLLDETYAEHISRAGAMVSGFTQTTRVNEPGRTLWARVTAEF